MRAALILIAISGAVLASESRDDSCTASPNGQFRACVVKVAETNTRRLELRSKDGKSLYSSPSQIDGEDVFDFYPQHLLWSPDSKVLAIGGGHWRKIQTYLFAWDGVGFNQISLPALSANSDYDNAWVLPAEWKSDDRLILSISGPHAGKAGAKGYSGKAYIGVDPIRKSATKINERIIRLPAEAR